MSVNIAKQTTPTGATNYNKLFTKIDGSLAWIDENNVEHIVAEEGGVQSDTPGTLTSSGGFTPLDITALGSNGATLTLTEDTVLQYPTNIPTGFTGINIVVTQDATTAHTLTLDTGYRTADGTAITVSTTLGEENLLVLQKAGSYVWASLLTNGIA